MFPESNELEAYICLIAGGSRGIGAAIARAVAARGAHVIINYRSSELEALRLARELREKGAGVLAIRADLSRENEVERMFTRIEAEMGNVNAMVYNAGISQRGLLIESSEEQWDRVMNTNLKGAFLCSRRALPYMIRERFGRIINIASVLGITGASYESIYSSAKGGLIALTRSLAQEVGPSGITVNAIAPGPIFTDMLREELDEEEMADLTREIPVGRLGCPEDVAAACVFLLGREASFINGHILSLDGGWRP
ncbi:MAG: 3-oxoacyl-ACP reductase FabG [Syntrophomonas sp.]|uniref:elongation factor P 5-aminopentanone reductase n=1 Tax=Syntrophomonas sp. TaxID=2053627 RepID=UPI00260DCD3F|nr:3-oxoacyl-ACP reductase FabG [Syntrophomonas sp.]MDD2510335.1 3-oxoacyl-ACP reductase FabG [Syntrophomonas sp.]MDD3880143.1 3-oxoacyl-ACP reductase FabG [Syntrophomonas sp.]MDD4625657.1 3-oxoacyl-ACP reductase FabG [Syntrophomonas sp.]